MPMQANNDNVYKFEDLKSTLTPRIDFLFLPNGKLLKTVWISIVSIVINANINQTKIIVFFFFLSLS